MFLKISVKKVGGYNYFTNLAFSNKQNMEATMIKSPEELIIQHLQDNGQKMNWLAEKVGVTVGHLHSVLKGDEKTKRALTEENLKKINEALGTDFKF